MTEQQQKAMLRAEMDRQGVTDPELRAGIAAIAMGESGFRMKPEMGYSHTHNDRIRDIFGVRVVNLSDVRLSQLKADDRGFFNFVYGGHWGKTYLGNTQPNDGFNFRGRGLFQLTGRANYEHYGKMIGHDLISNPDLADTPEVACAIAVAYMRDRYKGGGWYAMLKAVGNNTPDIEAKKTAAFHRYVSSGEFA